MQLLEFYGVCTEKVMDSSFSDISITLEVIHEGNVLMNLGLGHPVYFFLLKWRTVLKSGDSFGVVHFIVSGIDNLPRRELTCIAKPGLYVRRQLSE